MLARCTRNFRLSVHIVFLQASNSLDFENKERKNTILQKLGVKKKLFDSYQKNFSILITEDDAVSHLVTTCNAQKRKPEWQRWDDTNNRTVALSTIQT